MMNLDCKSQAALPRSTDRRTSPLVAILAASMWLACAGSSFAGRPSRSNPNAADAPAQAPAKSVAAKSVGAISASTPKIDPAGISSDSISARLKQLENAKDADVPDRAKLVELYQQALTDLKQTDEQKARGDEFDKARIAAPYQLESRKREAAAKPAAPAPLPQQSSLADWEQMLAPAQQELDAAQKDLKTQKRRTAAARRSPRGNSQGHCRRTAETGRNAASRRHRSLRRRIRRPDRSAASCPRSAPPRIGGGKSPAWKRNCSRTMPFPPSC